MTTVRVVRMRRQRHAHKRQLRRSVTRFIKRFMKWLKPVPNFVSADGSKLYVDSGKDKFGLPKVFIAQPHVIQEVEPDPKDQRPVTTGRKIPVIVWATVGQVIELIDLNVITVAI